MLLPRRIGEHRATVILVVLVALSLISLASGTQANWVSRYVRTGVSVAATPFWRAMGLTSSTADYVSGLFISYNATRQELQDLRLQLAQTVPDQAALDELRAQNQRLREKLSFANQHSDMSLRLSRVKVIGTFDGTLIIDRGSVHGITEAMSVITPDGIVGVVKNAEPFQSLVYTLHHPDCRVGAMIQRNRSHGIVHGSGSDYSHICRMEYIDMKDEVRPGDIVVTSGGAVFPAGLPIGRIIAPPQGEGLLLKAAYVEPFANPYRLDEVFVVMQAQMDADDLAGWEAPEPRQEAPGIAATMPDGRPLQERLAP